MSKDIDVLFESLERTQKNIIRRRWKHGGSNIIVLFATGARNIKAWHPLPEGVEEMK